MESNPVMPERNDELPDDLCRAMARACLEQQSGRLPDHPCQSREACEKAAQLAAKRLQAAGVVDEQLCLEILREACDFVARLRQIAQTPAGQTVLPADDAGLSTPQMLTQERQTEDIWSHTDVYQAFLEGLTSAHCVQFDAAELERLAVHYLDRPWLNAPLFDWYIVDMLMAHAVVRHGEATKRDKGLFLTAYNDPAIDYRNARGDLRKMKKAAEQFRVRNFLYKKLGGDKEAIAAMELWGRMAKAYDLLKGPPVIPALLIKELERTRKAGAAWSPIIFRIAGRALG